MSGIGTALQVRQPQTRDPQFSTAATNIGRTTCRCGQPARIRTLVRYEHGKPVQVDTCLACRKKLAIASSKRNVGRYLLKRTWSSSVLISAGTALAAGATLADKLVNPHLTSSAVYQATGVVIGAACFLTGLTMRIASVAVLGCVIFSAALLVELTGFRGSPGFGLKQQLLLVVGTGFIAFGLARSMRTLRHLSRPNPELAG